MTTYKCNGCGSPCIAIIEDSHMYEEKEKRYCLLEGKNVKVNWQIIY